MRALLFGTTFFAMCIASSASIAASSETDAFVANVRLHSHFLAQASNLAGDRSENHDLRTFATSEAAAEELVVAAIDARMAPEMIAETPALTVASNEVMTGRSAAIDKAPAFPAPAGTGALMPAALITLDRLSASRGQAFDTLYKTTQVNALRQLAGFYNAYAMTGDDGALKQLARSELAATHDRIAEIGRF